jgi:hypothetical protein
MVLLHACIVQLCTAQKKQSAEAFGLRGPKYHPEELSNQTPRAATPMGIAAAARAQRL